MRKIIVCFVLSIVLMSACSSVDCPVENVVATYYGLYKSDGTPDTLTDTLTIYTTMMSGADSVVLNRAVGISSFSLPISYTNEGDTFIFIRYNDYLTAYDSVVIAKDNVAHFESADCQISYFHNIRSVYWTPGAIDSIVVETPFVDYDSSKEHFRIYFKDEM